MKAQELSHKYATAVFSLALDDWLSSLNAVQDKLTTDTTLIETVDDPSASFSERQKALERVIPTGTDQHIKNFLFTLLKDGNIGLLGNVIDEIGRLARGGPQVEVARVTTAVALSDGEKKQFAEKLRKKYDETIDCEFNVDPAIMGGAVIQIGDKVIDGSVANRLESMSNLLRVK